MILNFKVAFLKIQFVLLNNNKWTLKNHLIQNEQFLKSIYVKNYSSFSLKNRL